MKLALALAAISTLGVSLSGKQDVRTVPIPTTYPNAHGEPLPNAVIPLRLQTATSTSGKLDELDQEDLPLRIPLRGQMDQHVQPIPNWKEPPLPQTPSLQIRTVHACVIVEDDGKGYKYVEGVAMRGMESTKQFKDSDIHKIVAAGGWVKILKQRYSADDLARERKGCLEGSKTIDVPSGKKP